MVNANFTTDGMEGWGAVQGPKASSTRSEIAGGIGAALAPSPIHIGSDNLAFVRRAKLIIARNFPPNTKPWELWPDGDLWALFEKVVLQQGTRSIRVSWVTGHA